LTVGIAATVLAAGGLAGQASHARTRQRADAGGQAYVTTHTHATPLASGDSVVGAMNAHRRMHITVSLKLRHEAQLKAFLANPDHAVLTTAQFRAKYSPTQAQAQEVANYLKSSGFSNVHVAKNRMLVSGDASVGRVQKAFHTHIAKVRTHNGRTAFANTRRARVPLRLRGQVLSVLGLQNVHTLHTFARTADAEQASTNSITGHNPTEFDAIYGASNLPTASGVTVGIVTSGDLSNVRSDLQQFTSNNGLSSVNTQTINTNGTGSSTSGDGEWDLDSQDIVGMGGGQVGKLIFYNIPSLSNSNLTADFNKIVNDNVAKVVNVSLGECETSAKSDGSASSQDQIFQQADAQGQTISVSSGDSGADECSNGGTTPSWPASSQYVVAVGGTTLDASTTTWNSATAWSKTGGSESTFEPMPSWQQGVGQNSGAQYRGVPDIAYDADPSSGSLVIVDGQQKQIGGTSLASPLFVGLWARVLAAKGTNFGFAAPKIYNNLTESDFHDITSGSNGGESAATGWDYTTGFGEMIGSKVINDIGGGSGGGNSAPTASNGSVSTTTGTAVSGTLSASDSDGDSLTFSIVSQPSHGSVSITNTSTGAFTYTPNSGYTGSDSFTFKATDSAGNASNTATESVTISSSNTAPTASNGSVSTDENTAVSGTLSASDSDGDSLTFSIVSQPSNGSVSITNSSTGAFTYTPNSNYYGSDSFTFKATDSAGNASNTATESVTVNQTSGGGCSSGFTKYTGSVSSGGDSYEPNGSYYQAPSGAEKGQLSGPSSADFDLYLDKWSSYWGWTSVASSTSNTSSESINYSGSSGYYMWDIYAYSGSGNYTLCISHP